MNELCMHLLTSIPSFSAPTKLLASAASSTRVDCVSPSAPDGDAIAASVRQAATLEATDRQPVSA